jgi:hypothetical protein
MFCNPHNLLIMHLLLGRQILLTIVHFRTKFEFRGLKYGTWERGIPGTCKK